MEGLYKTFYTIQDEVVRLYNPRWYVVQREPIVHSKKFNER